MHTIRLRGPWQLEPVARFEPESDGTYRATSENLPPATRAKMPANWADAFGPGFLGRVRYVRTFQKPTGLESGGRVFLVVSPPQSEGCILLGGQLLGFVYPGESAQRFDITERLDSHNTVEIFVDHPALDELRSKVGDPAALPPGGLVGEVRLEIEE